MYSRSFSDGGDLPPHYSGTALQRPREEPPHGTKEEAPPSCRADCKQEEPRHIPDTCADAKKQEASRQNEECGQPEGLLARLLPGVAGGDLLLLGIALLLLFDGCEDEFLPLVLLFLLVVH